MNQTLTIRLPGPAMRRVRERAKALHITPSDLVRSALERELGGLAVEASAFDLSRRWVGAVASTDVAAGRDARLELAAWHPDRRG